MSTPTPTSTPNKPPERSPYRRPEFRNVNPRRLTGWCGVGMVAAILVNGPLSQALQRTPSYWDAGAAPRLAAYLSDDANVDQMVVFFAASNLIFVFAIGFLAGLRQVPHRSNLSGWGRGVIAIGSALFLAGGLLSETLSTGIAVVLRTTPDYHLDVNTALLLQGLWSTALAQGQVALAVVILTVSALALAAGGLPRWLAWLGIITAVITILRPALITHTPLFIAAFQPTVLWIAAISLTLLRKNRPPTAAKRRTGLRRNETPVHAPPRRPRDQVQRASCRREPAPGTASTRAAGVS